MLHDLDVALLRLINGQFTCGLMDRLAVAIQNPWWLWPPLALALVWLAVRHGRDGWRFLVVAVAAVALTDVFCSAVLKPLIARPRPMIELDDVRALVGRKSSWSMPSNHAANLAAAAMLVAWRWRRWAWPAGLAALLVGYARVYVGAHYPLDVVTGWAVGATIGALAAQLLLPRPAATAPVPQDNPGDPPFACG